MNSNCGTDHVKSSWICIAGLPNELTEGDIITVFSQFGEVVNINLLRHRQTGRSRGMCFLCYQNLASTILAVDNFNGVTLLRRRLKVNYVDDYKLPKYREDADEGLKQLLEEGCAPKPISLHTSKKHKGCYNRRLKYDVKDEEDKRDSQLKKKKKKEERNSNDRESNHAIRKNIPFKGNDVLKNVKFNPSAGFPTVKADWRDVEIWKETQKRRGTNFSERVPACDFVYVPKRYLC